MGTAPTRMPSSLWKAGATNSPAFHFCLSLGFFLAEVVVSRVAGSLLSLSSAFHTLAGALALGAALAESRLGAGGRCGRANTFGWARARLLGTLAGAVFLSALCLALVPEAFRRVANPQATGHTLALMGVGAVGIPVHLARAGLHERHAQDLGAKHCCSRRKVTQAGTSAQEMEGLLGNEASANGQPWTVEVHPVASAEKPGELCLTWMVSCLGPLTVLLYSLTFHLLVDWTPCLGHGTCLNHCPKSPCWAWGASEPLRPPGAPCWLLYLDPGLAIAVAGALLWLAWPALRGSALVLLQAVPEELDLSLLELDLQATEGVVAVRELHVWQLDGPSSLVATAHVSCHDTAGYGAIISRVQQVFCQHGIHAATVQPDFGPVLAGRGHIKCATVPPMRCPGPSSAEVTEYETTV
ncbi:hypothetical protein JRQ81_009666 [Phrynocephalus forsythii]|uniref:Cation efflux protein transmembrane domain-containing protein n=1 Tax=Phrynocephalus forsythii TaxID=171643 RepID=A0A9Q0XAP4_9SAUR|nr:hypothetical protein JRQ81_009666 [Phrynocephalus forsythii]